MRELCDLSGVDPAYFPMTELGQTPALDKWKKIDGWMDGRQMVVLGN